LVVIEKCADYDIKNVREALDKALDELGGIGKFVKPGMRVALKPNLIGRKRPKDAATTHPAIVQAISDIIVEAGAKPVIAESPGGIYSERVLKGIYSICGIEKAAAAAGAELNYDISQVNVENPVGKYLKKVTVLKPLVDADVIINLPKLKSHGQMVYTGAVKNMFGAVPGVLKAEYHLRLAEYNDFANGLIDIFLSVKPVLNIMDAVTGMEGNGPTAGTPKKIGLIMASENAFELDLAALNVIGAKPSDVPVLKNAIKRGLCSKNAEEIKLAGEKLSDVRLDSFNLPGLVALHDLQFFKSRIAKSVINKLKPKPVFLHEFCIGCSECANNCPAKIIQMKRANLLQIFQNAYAAFAARSFVLQRQLQ
jgi:uncharacterized protein (DUF362 family)